MKPPPSPRRPCLATPLLLLLAAPLAGCTAPAAPPASQAASPAPVAGAIPASGPAAAGRVLRNYAAASGRECQEILTGSGLGERSSLYCRDGAGWVPARPLLRGGATR